jgi:hypothetical protein
MRVKRVETVLDLEENQQASCVQPELNQIFLGASMNETMWRCDQLRAGQLYNRMMFDTKAEAENFAQRMRQMEPDQIFAIEAIEASRVWN